ncbi:MAG: STAS domain-containing protein [Candidatus Eisenbacteria bacterium]
MISRNDIDHESVVINPGKVMDNSNAHEVTKFITALQKEGCKNVVMDMSQLEFLSSAGVGSILGTVGRAREMGGDIILCNLSKKVLHILEVLDLCGYLTIRENEEAAKEVCSARE